MNNYFDNINEEDSKYYNPTQPNLKTSKSNYKESKSIYERRKKYKVPPIKTNNESIENSKENEEGKRDQLISELIYNSEVGFIQDFQKKVQEETNGKEYKDIEQKIIFLQDNNIDVQQLLQENEEEENENEKEEKEKEEKENEKEKEEKEKEEKKQNEINLRFHSMPKRNNYIDEKNDLNYIKQKKKPNVNFHEFEEIINEYRRNNKINDSKIKNYEDNKKNNSFRKISYDNKEKDKSKIVNADSKTRLVFDSDNNFQLAYKGKNENKRPKKELKDFMKKKDEVRKENEIKEYEKKKKKI